MTQSAAVASFEAGGRRDAADPGTVGTHTRCRADNGRVQRQAPDAA